MLPAWQARIPCDLIVGQRMAPQTVRIGHRVGRGRRIQVVTKPRGVMRRIAGCILGIAIVGALARSDGPTIADPCEDAGCSQFHLDGAAAFEETCSACHSHEAPLAASVSLHDEAWALIGEMNDNGLTLPEIEEAAIVEYMCTINSCEDEGL
jgi:hypothetical protein